MDSVPNNINSRARFHDFNAADHVTPENFRYRDRSSGRILAYETNSGPVSRSRVVHHIGDSSPSLTLALRRSQGSRVVHGDVQSLPAARTVIGQDNKILSLTASFIENCVGKIIGRKNQIDVLTEDMRAKFDAGYPAFHQISFSKILSPKIRMSEKISCLLMTSRTQRKFLGAISSFLLECISYEKEHLRLPKETSKVLLEVSTYLNICRNANLEPDRLSISNQNSNDDHSLSMTVLHLSQDQQNQIKKSKLEQFEMVKENIRYCESIYKSMNELKVRGCLS